MTTLSEVARLAGVTSATVSNVLRQRGKVGEQTRLRVLEAVEQLGYRPHLTARALAEGRAPTLALMVSSIANPFYPEFALAAERAARAHGRFLIVCNTNDDPATGRAYLDQIAGTLSDGVLIMNANLPMDDLKKTEKRGAPVVLCMWEKPDAPPELPSIAVDFRAAGAIAGRHLIELGHRDIGALVGSKKNGIHAERYRGYLDACAEAGRKHAQERTRYIPDTVAAGYDATMAMLKEFPQLTAIFASNDLPALGAMNAIADMGLNVPRDISVIGITDIQWARLSRPALTTVAVPTDSAAEMSIELLLALINRSSKSPVMRVTATPELVRRASTAPPKKR
ncbi:LacI family DNA-binding transcriptional regulator [Herbaspirillum robiniae]|uniref:LacI family transcriptional regulator n=1 Tax=Herbaspirillum robiniae TaxID=2014887 RepID=A0A246WM22_9BURK|nr:LacI family DNA-binding transcriptional regulator [Herbaspirillum robiniae]NUU03000.1 LacI family transcriptional regulator [Herbaspirillum robiniae]OWY27374.1 LacI family transcriptional regulator [Herbaspirillum robiniae]